MSTRRKKIARKSRKVRKGVTGVGGSAIRHGEPEGSSQQSPPNATSTIDSSCTFCGQRPTSITVVTSDGGDRVTGLLLCKQCASNSDNTHGRLVTRPAAECTFLHLTDSTKLRRRAPQPVKDFRFRARPTLVEECINTVIHRLHDIPVRGFQTSLDHMMRTRLLARLCKANRRLSNRFIELLPSFAFDFDREATMLSDARMNDHDIAMACYFCSFDHPKTHSLYLSWNPMGMLAARGVVFTIGRCTNLRHVDVSWCRLGIDGIRLLFRSLAHNSVIEALNVAGNDACGREAGTIVSELLTTNTTLRRLSVAFNELGVDGAKSLAVGLPNCTVQDLSLRGCSIGDEGATTIATALKDNKVLQSLTVADNGMGEKGASMLASFVRLRLGAAIRMVDPEGLCMSRAAHATDLLPER